MKTPNRSKGCKLLATKRWGMKKMNPFGIINTYKKSSKCFVNFTNFSVSFANLSVAL